MKNEVPYPMWKIREPKHAPLQISCEYREEIKLQQPQPKPKVEEIVPDINLSEIPDL